MENLIFFVLGTLFATGLIGLWFLIKRVLKISMETQTLKHNINVNSETTSNSFNKVHERIDGVYKLVNNNTNDIHKKINELQSYIDSRIDKTIDLSFERMYRSESEKNTSNK